MQVLNGKRFIAFRRMGSDRRRYFFVQYEARIPVYSFDSKSWRKVKPETYFQKDGSGLSMKPKAIYVIVLTQPIKLHGVVIKGVKHPKCKGRKCNGMSQQESTKLAQKIAIDQFRRFQRDNKQYQEFVRRFPDIAFASVDLDPD